MDNWTSQNVLRFSRFVSLIIWGLIFSPFLLGLVVGFMVGFFELDYSLFSGFISLFNRIAAWLIFLLFPLLLVSASEISGRTARFRVSLAESGVSLGRLEQKELKRFYRSKPYLFPWHYALRLPACLVIFTLKIRLCGIPRSFLES